MKGLTILNIYLAVIFLIFVTITEINNNLILITFPSMYFTFIMFIVLNATLKNENKTKTKTVQMGQSLIINGGNLNGNF